MPRTSDFNISDFDIESPIRSISTMSKTNRYLLFFLIAMVLFIAIYIPLRVIPQNKNDEYDI